MIDLGFEVTIEGKRVFSTEKILNILQRDIGEITKIGKVIRQFNRFSFYGIEEDPNVDFCHNFTIIGMGGSNNINFPWESEVILAPDQCVATEISIILSEVMHCTINVYEEKLFVGTAVNGEFKYE